MLPAGAGSFFLDVGGETAVRLVEVVDIGMAVGEAAV